jgi:hypothetical protein
MNDDEGAFNLVVEGETVADRIPKRRCSDGTAENSHSSHYHGKGVAVASNLP